MLFYPIHSYPVCFFVCLSSYLAICHLFRYPIPILSDGHIHIPSAASLKFPTTLECGAGRALGAPLRPTNGPSQVEGVIDQHRRLLLNHEKWIEMMWKIHHEWIVISLAFCKG
jgi:hypothetical protein